MQAIDEQIEIATQKRNSLKAEFEAISAQMDSAKLIAQDALKTIRASADQVAEMIQATKNAEKEVEKLNIELFNLEAQDTKRRAYMKNCIRAQELKNEELRSSIKQLKEECEEMTRQMQGV